MLLKPDDRIRVTLSEAGTDGVRADASEWSNVDSIEVNVEVAGYTLTPGTEMQAVVDAIDGLTATVTQVPGSYDRHTAPGGRFEMTVERMAADAVGQASLDDASRVDRIVVPQVAPLETVLVEVVKVRDGLAVGESVRTLEPGILPGDTVRTRTIPGETTVSPVEGEYRIETGHEALVETTVEVRVDTVGAPSTGTLVDFGELPVEGTNLTTSVTEGEKRAVPEHGQFVISLTDPALLSGTVTVRVTERGEEDLSGVISDYRGILPETGETVSAKVYTHSRTARPSTGRYTVQLQTDPERSGLASVRITEVSDSIYGVVDEYHEEDDDEDDVVGSKNSLLNGTSL
jgi:hypothetical protein